MCFSPIYRRTLQHLIRIVVYPDPFGPPLLLCQPKTCDLSNSKSQQVARKLNHAFTSKLILAFAVMLFMIIEMKPKL